MVFYDMQEFGGLEEYAAALAVGLQQEGHAVSAVSAMWIPADNQYLRTFRQHNIPVAQLPKWLSWPASHWATKEKLLALVMMLLTPLVYVLGAGVCLRQRRPWPEARTSAYHWLREQVMGRFIAPDRRRPFTRLLLAWWRFWWRFDVLHLHGYTTNLLFVIDWAHDKGLPVVYEEHQTPDAQFGWWQDFQQSVNQAAIVVAVSEKSAEALRTVCGVTQPIIVRNPLLPDPLAAGWQKDQNPQPSAEPLRVTTVARLYVTKGLVYLLEAIKQVKATHPAVEFRVYGDGPLRQELLDYAAKLGLEGEQIFVGPFTDRQALASIMAQTDIFVMSSVLEGQPLAVVEAMAYGRPIVATSVGGIPELIQDGVNGFLCQPGDAACLAQKINTLVEDPMLRQTLGQQVRCSYEQGPFQPAALSKHFTAIYQQALRPERQQSDVWAAHAQSA